MNTPFIWTLFIGLALFSTSSHAQIVKCVENAERNAEGRCVCKAGFAGNGELCCLPDDHKLCMVEGDPVIYTMNGDLLPFDLPCVTKMAEIHTVGDNYDESINAYIAGEYRRNGILAMDYLKLELRERYNNIHTLVEIYNGKLVINGEVHNKSEPFNSVNYEVQLEYDEPSGTYTLRSMGATIVKYVPPSKATDEQRSLPGLCMGVAFRSLLYGVGMCNQRKRGFLRNTYNNPGVDYLHTGVVDHLVRRLPDDQRFGPSSILETCDALNEDSRQCGDRWKDAMGACTIIVSHPDARYCMGLQGIDPLSVFRRCARAHCGLDKDSCDYMATPSVSKCLPPIPDCQALY